MNHLTWHTEDIDECSSPQVCSPGENCVNTMGSFQCVSACDLGFRLDSRSERCEDIDECAVGLAACFLGASCINTLGSYRCACGSGYQEVNGVCEDKGRSLGCFVKKQTNFYIQADVVNPSSKLNKIVETLVQTNAPPALVVQTDLSAVLTPSVRTSLVRLQS